jgi:two-component system, chemotaxis family, sensor kinase Cph1
VQRDSILVKREINAFSHYKADSTKESDDECHGGMTYEDFDCGRWLAFSHMGREEIHHARVDSGSVVRAVIETLQSEIKDRKIEWVIGALPEVLGDSNMLRIVWSNLLGNALKYTRSKEMVKIEIGATIEHQHNNHVAFFVKDNGVGFDMKFKDKLFGLFQRLHSKSEFEGNGVGLANL